MSNSPESMISESALNPSKQRSVPVQGSVEIRNIQTKTGKYIIHDMKVEFPQNSITAILGPSGSGKSTFLNFVSGNLSGVKASGKVELTGTNAMIPQDDHLHGFYTCQSYLEHYTRLSGQNLDHRSKKRISDILADLGLTACKDVRVGDIFIKGLSGGQKRRLSVALEANSDPENLFLDEPTSGLDSESAYRVMKFLKGYAKEGKGRRVILTIHQPSSYLWELIDNVVILAKGKLIYSGPREQMETFFEITGFPTPPNFNPADHYVTVANDEFETNENKLSVDAWATAFKKFTDDPDFVENKRSTKLQIQIASTLSPSERAGDLGTTFELVRRYFLNLWFNPGMLLVRVFMYSALSLMLGILFWNLGDNNSYGSIQSRIGLLFYVGAFFVFMSVAVLPFTVQEKSIVDKEVRNGYYHPAVYQLAQALSSIPGVIVLAGMGTGIIIGMTDLREGGWYFLNLTLALFCAEALAQLVSHIVPHFIIGIALIAGCYGMFMLLEGFMLIPSEFPTWIKWAYYVPFHTYSWRTFMYKEFSSSDANFDSSQFPTGMDVLRAYEIEDVNPVNDMVVLLCYGLVLHLISFGVLHLKYVLFQRKHVSNQ